MKRLLLAVLPVLLCLGCAFFNSPAKEARLFLESPAGQKLVDTINTNWEGRIVNPSVGFYLKTGGVLEMNGIDVMASISTAGEVSEDERGTADPFPVVVPVTPE